MGIGRAAIAGTGLEETWLPLASLITEKSGNKGIISGIALDGTHLYWSAFYNVGSPPPLFIGRATIAGGTIEKTWIPEASEYGGRNAYLAVNSEYIYWCEPLVGSGTLVGRATISGGSVEQGFVNGAGRAVGLATQGSKVYWLNENGTIGSVSKTGTELNPSLYTHVATLVVHALAANSEHLWWNENAATEAGYVARGSINGQAIGSSITVAQAGNRKTPLTFKINGRVVNPTIINGTGQQISLTGEVGSGNYLLVNTAERTVELNGSSNALGLIVPSLTSWPGFDAPPAPATETYKLTATTEATSATLEALYRSAYA